MSPIQLVNKEQMDMEPAHTLQNVYCKEPYPLL